MQFGTNEFQTNSVTYPRSRFMRGSCAPIISGEKAQQEPLSVTAIGASIFDPNTIMVTCDPHHGKGMTCCLWHRKGAVLENVDAVVALIRTKGIVPFVNWSHTFTL